MKKGTLLIAGAMLILVNNIQAAMPTVANQKITEIVAYLDHKVSVGNFELMYDSSPIADSSVYGVRTNALNWEVSYRYSNCDDFSAIQQHLSVRDSGHNLKTVTRYTCSVR